MSRKIRKQKVAEKKVAMFLYAYHVLLCLLFEGIEIISIKEQGKHKGTTVPVCLVLISVKEHVFLFAYKK